MTTNTAWIFHPVRTTDWSAQQHAGQQITSKTVYDAVRCLYEITFEDGDIILAHIDDISIEEI
jgi:hypothetical protein